MSAFAEASDKPFINLDCCQLPSPEYEVGVDLISFRCVITLVFAVKFLIK